MIQLILTYLAIAYAIGYTLWATYKSFFRKKQGTNSGVSCSAGCSNCSMPLKSMHKSAIHSPRKHIKIVSAPGSLTPL